MLNDNSLKISIIIATAFREGCLLRTLECLAGQTCPPHEVIVVDGAPAPGVEAIVAKKASSVGLSLVYERGSPPSAAAQRNLGASAASGEILLFLDDDAYTEPDCLEKIQSVFANDSAKTIGGVGALLSNQHSDRPSPRALRWFQFLAGDKRQSYSGAVIGPAVNLLPEATEDGRIVPVEWLNSTCTAYRREAFASERFGQHFVGYSFMEDVDLSVRIGRRWKLVVHTGAQAYHDSQPSRFKRPFQKAKMGVENQYYVMSKTLGRNSLSDHFRFLVNFVVGRLSAFRAVRRPADALEQLQSICGGVIGLLCVARQLSLGGNFN